MPHIVPLPGPDEVDLGRPHPDEVRVLAAAMATATAGPGGLTDTQRAVINELCLSMTDVAVDVSQLEPVDAGTFAETLRRRDHAFRVRIVQTMLLAELILVPLPPEVTEKVEDYAIRLGVSDEMMRVAREVSHGSLGLALIDFERSGYFQELLDRPPDHLHVASAMSDAWQASASDAALYERWCSLGECAEGTLGRGVFEFYEARGFTFPGQPSSAPPTLAQHDFVHVIADYGSTVECEIEVFGLISRANDDPSAFALLAMVLGLFETGYLYGAARGFFGYDRGHLSGDAERMAVRLADAMYRGAMVGTHLGAEGRGGETDLLGQDWFAHADRPLEELRADYGLPPRSARAIAAGSVTPWEPGGISPFQAKAGMAAAAERGVPYQSYGATP